MKRFLFFTVIILSLVVLSAPAYAQEVNASGSLGVLINPNQSSGNRFNNVGLH
jgi:hypothetical protein